MDFSWKMGFFIFVFVGGLPYHFERMGANSEKSFLRLFLWFLFLFIGIFTPYFELYIFIGNNYYAILGVVFFILSYIAWEFLREHPAEKIYQAYKGGRIKRQQAVTMIVDSMHNHQSSALPPAYKSKLMTRRLNALTRRVKAERKFVDELFEYMKAKARHGE